MNIIKHYVDGQAYDGTSGKTQPVLNPSLGKPQSEVALANVDDINHVIESSAQAQKVWAKLNPQKRVRIIMKWISLINENMDSLATTLSLEHGKTFQMQREIFSVDLRFWNSLLVLHISSKVSTPVKSGLASIPTLCVSHLALSQALRLSISQR